LQNSRVERAIRARTVSDGWLEVLLRMAAGYVRHRGKPSAQRRQT
jgi:hypothetical protein